MPRRTSRRSSLTAGLAFALLATTVLGSGCGSDDALADRQATIAEAGSEVMPFDLDQTTHVFTETENGGVQDVVADDPADNTSIELIRDHLALEAEKFSQGDFSDPTTIHGADMPGLATLKTGYADIEVTLSSTDTGATITYETADPALITAIHDWFQAQASDHGSHAEHHGS